MLPPYGYGHAITARCDNESNSLVITVGDKIVKRNKKVSQVLRSILLLLLCCPLLAIAQDEAAEVEVGEDGEPIPVKTAVYVPLQPPFVVNYGGKGRLKYLRAELSVRVADSQLANSIRHHLPFIRNQLVLLFSRQTEETVNSVQGREELRNKALEAVKGVILEEDELEGVEDLFFTNFVVQR
jgi:flagellar FliL protein